jgi:hypothetical protein
MLHSQRHLSADEQNSNESNKKDFSKWLGRQKGIGLYPLDDDYREEFEDLYDVQLDVVRGAQLLREDGLKNVVGFDGEAVTAFSDWTKKVDKDATYVYGRVRAKDEWRKKVYIVDCAIQDGPLKGAIVHLRDRRVPKSDDDSYSGFYRIPDDIAINEGKLRFKIVMLSMK